LRHRNLVRVVGVQPHAITHWAAMSISK
jgi:hypothetical protein